MEAKKVILMILDGWGKGDASVSDAIYNSNTPNYNKFISNFPNSSLLTSGENVGLPDGQMGNSEVGHLNIGAGRIVFQDLVKINNEIKTKSFFSNPQLLKAFNYAKEHNKQVHFLGLLSDGGVHSTDEHLLALVQMSDMLSLNRSYIHILTDGRDTDPKSGFGFVEKLINNLKKSKVQIASLAGRYYTMDRDKRWDRIKLGYDLLTKGEGEASRDLLSSIRHSYDNDITDEFIKPIVMVNDHGLPLSTIQPDDVVICYNFRTDRLRQITRVLTQENMLEHGMTTIPLQYYTMTRYDESFNNINIIYEKDNLNYTLGEVVSNLGKRQLRIAETEKYAHVTFFFSGGREQEFNLEDRILVPSPKVATYDLQPEMSAFIVKDKLVEAINKNIYDLIVVNFANCDMVGHTGIYKAIQKAVETVDTCIGEVVNNAVNNNYSVMIIADHGNADFVINEDGSPNTAHSLNPVPCILINSDYLKIEDGILADVAPSILKLMNIEAPAVMTGKALF